jgi:hypothetical protein
MTSNAGSDGGEMGERALQGGIRRLKRCHKLERGRDPGTAGLERGAGV